MLAMPEAPKAIKRFVLRSNAGTVLLSEQIFITRSSVWAASWDGFKKRPLLGWGFGADDSISKYWDVKFTAIGVVSRDSINDTLITLESTGVIGLIAYAMLVILALKQMPTRRERFLLREIHAPPRDAGSFAHDNHAIAFIISVTLLVTVQFDNTALSAGNFVSVMIWLCVALAGSIKGKVMAYESTICHYQNQSKRVQTTSFKGSHSATAVGR